MTRTDDALTKLKDLHETAHRQVDRDERGIPVNSEHMRRASDAVPAAFRLNRLGRDFMFRAMEAMAEDWCNCCMNNPADPVLSDLADAILGKEKAGDCQSALEAVRALSKARKVDMTIPSGAGHVAELGRAHRAALAYSKMARDSIDALVTALEANLIATRHPPSCRTCQSGDDCKARSELAIKATRQRNLALAAIKDAAQEALR